MNILSFTFWTGCHDTSAAIVCDGRLVAAIEEERFSRRKHEGRLPVASIEFCLAAAGLTMRDIDVLAIPDKPYRTGPDSQMADTDLETIKDLVRAGHLRNRAILHKRGLQAALALGLRANLNMATPLAQGLRDLRERFGQLPPLRFYEHHRAHAAVAYFSSPFDHAAIATIDGRGGTFATATWKGQGNLLTRLRTEPSTNSLGFFYRDTTNYLGLGAFSEGKAMGLASYGDPSVLKDKIDQLLDVNGDRWYEYRQQPTKSILGFVARTSETLPGTPYADFAAASQASVEKALARITTSAMQDAGSENLCLGGGVALNCSSNGVLLASGVAKNIFVFPATGDAGLPIGAAYLCSAESDELQREHLQSAAWGSSFSDAEYEKAIRSESRISFSKAGDVAEETARFLAAGQVVGWFQGKMELGPRALGQRSIIADPRTVEMRDRVNRIKGREAWRPLAPMILLERAAEFVDPPVDSPFMLFAVKVRPEKRSEIPAVVHVDGTARPQSIAKERSPLLHRLISGFERSTGVPVVLNTSFNLAHEPIVCTPEDAVKTFLDSELDVLVLGDYLVRKRA